MEEKEEEKQIEKENQIKDTDEEDLEKCIYKPVDPNPPSPLEVSVN